MINGMNGQRLTDDICRSVLNRAHKRIVEEMLPDEVLFKLREIGFLSQEDYIAIGRVADRPTKNRSLVGKIKQSGKRAYCDFKTILEETGQKVLMLQLESKEKELEVETAGHSVEQRLGERRTERMETNETPELPAATRSPPEPPAATRPPPAENPLSSLDRSVVVVKTIQKDLHDGRLIELNSIMIEQLKRISKTDDKLKGGFGRVYISNERAPGFKIRVVLKEIELQAGNLSQTQKLGSVTNEKIASRLMHFGIVPLLAFHDDHLNRKYYFVSPYLENGDLYEAIAADRDREEKDIQLPWKTRIKIMYQIACAIDFMHTGNTFRRTVVHMDIKSKNIVLDTFYNARLIDFGLAREFKEDGATSIITSASGGTPGYFTNVQPNMLTKNQDYHNFGVGKYSVLKYQHYDSPL
ncbi:uncharacterized protein LOC127854468 [Dreissena polymorpha]|uniref:uncharacterized protein LOC127854468 n=1 Tax=Dreissena polymorpha TaxID=45954 RepID=UPI002264B1A9|nr:uncharacterized protein LOC127854468 [Dreissena polymorpha]